MRVRGWRRDVLARAAESGERVIDHADVWRVGGPWSVYWAFLILTSDRILLTRSNKLLTHLLTRKRTHDLVNIPLADVASVELPSSVPGPVLGFPRGEGIKIILRSGRTVQLKLRDAPAWHRRVLDAMDKARNDEDRTLA